MRGKRIVKKHYMKTDQMNEHYNQENLDLQYVTILTDFVAKTLQAMCSFECLASCEPPGFIHKVCLEDILSKKRNQ